MVPAAVACVFTVPKYRNAGTSVQHSLAPLGLAVHVCFACPCLADLRTSLASTRPPAVRIAVTHALLSFLRQQWIVVLRVS